MSIDDYAAVTWSHIPQDAVEQMARERCHAHCSRFLGRNPTDDEWQICRGVWIQNLKRHHDVLRRIRKREAKP